MTDESDASDRDEEEDEIGTDSSESDDDDEPPQRSGIILKLGRRKRKSSKIHAGDGELAKRRRSSGKSGISPLHRADSSAASAASKHKKQYDVLNEADAEEEEVEEDAFDDDSDDDDRIEIPVKSIKNFLSRWKELSDLAKDQRQDTYAWKSTFGSAKGMARAVLESEDIAIVPSVTADTNAVEYLEELRITCIEARSQMQEGKEQRAIMHQDELEATRRFGFGRQEVRPAIQGNFVFDGRVGNGSTGTASAWVRQNAHGVVVDRVVIKDMYLKDSEWNRDLTFFGSIQDRIPREGHMHSLASSKDIEALCTVKYRESAVFRARKMIRLYMEHCPLGEFNTIWRESWSAQRERGQYPFASTAALWAIFECCAKAIHVMKFGCLPGEEVPDDWEEMVHRDIKSENVFMSLPDDSHWKNMPRVKLGDFGYAALVSERELLERSVGTIGYVSPELTDYRQRPAGFAVSSAADIFTLGMVMFDLMTGLVAPDRNYDFSDAKSEFPKIGGIHKKQYPAALVKLVLRCVRKWPLDRIEVKELCRRIEEEVKDIRSRGPSAEDHERFPWQSKVKEGMTAENLS